MKLTQQRAWITNTGETKLVDQVIITGGMSWDFEEARDYKEFTRADGTAGKVVNVNLVVDIGNDQVEYWRVAAYDDRAESFLKLKPYLRKGLKLLVIGDPRVDEYTAKDGTRKTQNVVNLFRFEVIGWPKREDGNAGAVNAQSNHDNLPDSFEPIDDFNDDDIPF